MIAGTGACGAAGIISGFALHDEVDYLAETGLDPLTTHRMTPIEPVRSLGEEGAFGRVAPECPPTCRPGRGPTGEQHCPP